MKIAESIKNHDLQSFKYYFDVDSVSQSAVQDLMSGSIQEVGGRGLLQRLIGVTIAGFFKPELAQILARNICTYVEGSPEENTNNSNSENMPPKSSAERSQPGEASNFQDSKAGPVKRAVKGFFKTLVEAIKPPSLKDVLKELGLNKKNFRGLTAFEISGSLCHVGMRFQAPEKKEVVVEVELENTDNHWHVTRFSNIGAIAQAVSGI